MTTIGIKELHAKGGGNVLYAWQVSGMPWAVCETAAQAAALDASTSARRAIFGLAVDGSSAYIADTASRCPIFSTLQRPGKISWQLQETKAQLSGGSWSVEIADCELAHAWFNFGSAGRLGLPGVHHIAQPLIDDTALWAELAADLEYDGTSLVVDQTGTGTDWETAIESDVSADGYRLAWMGGECLVLDNSVAGGTTVTILYRGAFMSRPQNHFVDPQGASPIVYDFPPSIAGQMCTLWACHMSDDGTSLLETPVPIRMGRVSPDITTEDGLTKININPILDNLNEDFVADYNNEAHIARYCFTRDDSGTDPMDVYNHFQSPHLVILERNIGVDDLWYLKPIWLCGKNDYVEFETLSEVLAALEQELACCSSDPAGDAYESQHSGNGDPDNDMVTLKYNYAMKDGYLYQTTGVNGAGTVGGSVTGDEISLISGPLAWLFNLGGIYYQKDDALAQLTYSPCPWFFYSAYTCARDEVPGMDITGTLIAPPYQYLIPQFGGWMCCAGGTAVGDWNFQNIVYSLGQTVNDRNKWRAQYYYEWLWDQSADCADWIDWGAGPAGEDVYLPSCWGNVIVDELLIESDKLYLVPQGMDDNVLEAGDQIVLGRPTDYKFDGYGSFPNNIAAPRYAKATLLSINDDASDYYMILSSRPSRVEGHPSPFRYGSGIYWLPALEDKMAAGQNPDVAWFDSAQNNGTFSALSFSNDPWTITSDTSITSDKLSDIFRAMLGDPGCSVTIPTRCAKTNIIGFTDQSDLWSMIDWDDLDNQTEGTRDILGLKYWVDCNSTINIATAFWNELLLHAVEPVLEWGYNTANTREQWWIRFRKLSPANMSMAEFSGRTLTESNLKRGTGTREQHSHTWISNKIEGELNYDNDKYAAKFIVSYRSSFVQGSDETATIKIKSQISHYTPSPEKNELFANHFRGMMKYFAQPNYANRCTGQVNVMYALALGRELLVTDRSAHDPSTHSLGLTSKPAFLVKMDQDCGGDGSIGLMYRLSNQACYGWAPSVFVDANHSTKSHGDTITCTPEIHTYSSSSMREDQMWFDCYEWNLSTGYVSKTCSCGNYTVIAHEIGDATPTLIGGSGELTVTSVSTAPQIVLLDNSVGHTHYGNWDTTKAHVISFDKWDQVESCQQKWIYFADDNNEIGTADDPAFRWV